ncbi:hypothetical protein [uncultured Sphingomonas sp.]|uniref:hypothetical protein n=1 Tax=uncultured Sphingomonas sp. TaxID=158754 RepID=UPI0035C9464B
MPPETKPARTRHVAADDRTPLVLLFYDGYELKAREALGPRLFHQARCRARAIWRRARGKQVNTGFYAAFLALVEGLRQSGCEVRINDFAAARARPGYPVGLAGYPDVLTRVDLPNPTIFGPGDPGYPDTAGKWARQDKVRYVIQPSQWYVDYYRPYCGDKMLRCPVGIDTGAIQDARTLPKSIDVLIYDKIRWHRDVLVGAVRDRLTARLEAAGLSYQVLEYGRHTQQMYFAALRAARSMAFLCEHETQGLACEEAMAMNVPVFVWEEGKLVDPRQQPFAAPGLVVSNVPYFDEHCGRTFTLDDLEPSFDAFWRDLDRFRPRDLIVRELSPTDTARVYLDRYVAMIDPA